MKKDRELPEDDSLEIVPEEPPAGAPPLSGPPPPHRATTHAVYHKASSGFIDEDAPRDSLSRFISRTASALEEPPETDEESILPRQPRNLVEVNLSKAFLTDLTLKIIHYSGTPSMSQLTRRLGLGPGIVQQLVTALSEERLVEVLSQSDLYTGNYRYRLSDRGHARVNEALERTRYAGPVPVTAEQYSEVMRKQLSVKHDVGRGHIKSILKDMVLSAEVSDAIARALFSGKASILYGPSGNGKTVVLERFAQQLEGVFLVPYAIYAYGQVIRVFDQSLHEPVEDLSAIGGGREDSKFDRRWVLIKRPAIILGAEMDRDSMDLAYDPQSRFYQAPPHIKAQGGVLIVDDFGRQKIDSRELLTRWLIPLERGWDTLSLVTGEKLLVPFRVQLLFGTNLPIKSLADDALLRRILYKVELPNPGAAEFMEIMRQACRRRRVLVEEGAIEYACQKLFSHPRLKPRGSYARDLTDMLIESASFDGREPVLNKQSFDHVFRLFVAQENEDDGGEN